MEVLNHYTVHLKTKLTLYVNYKGFKKKIKRSFPLTFSRVTYKLFTGDGSALHFSETKNWFLGE